jgi:predicted transcriptional regulator
MAITVRLPADLDERLDAVARERHVSKHALLLQGAQLIVDRNARRAEVDAGIDFVLAHDGELVTRLSDA